MNFLLIVLAVMVGDLLWGIIGAAVREIRDRMDDRRVEKRKIGFEGSEYSGKTEKGASMRKIGFGAND